MSESRFGWQAVFSLLIGVIVPLVLLMSAVRLLMTPVFVQVEYLTPGFPEDTYGFSQADRLKWSQMALDYLLNDEGINFLGDLQFADGSPLYNQRELSHMLDVKNLVQAGLPVWYALLLILLVLGVWSWRAGWWPQYRKGMGRGGRWTVVLIVLMILFIFINFDQLFTGFHRIFFEGDTWLFYFSDTLIRLFPMRFWRDAFILIGVITLGGGMALWYAFEYRIKRGGN
jgi:integral membrane protein (TIGR01906 family)